MKFEVLDNIFYRSREADDLWESVSAKDSFTAASKFCAQMDKESPESWSSRTVLVRRRTGSEIHKFVVKRSYAVTAVGVL